MPEMKMSLLVYCSKLFLSIKQIVKNFNINPILKNLDTYPPGKLFIGFCVQNLVW